MSQSETPETLARLEDLETKVVYQERTIDQLNEVVTKQQDQVDRLRLEVDQLNKTLKAISSLTVEGGEEPPPPHY